MSTPLILFANPRSGSTLAAEYLKLEGGRTSVSLASGPVTVLVFNILDSESKRSGFEAVRAHLRPDAVVRVFVAGGDGSLIWMLQDLIEEGLPLDRVAVSTLPFGTGNDLAAMLGWGRKPKTPLLGANLSEAAERWMNAVVSSLDLWDVDISVAEGGHFIKIAKIPHGFKKVVLYDSAGVKTRFQRLMSNYFSLGVDARIGFGFDKMRTKSQVLNKAVYAWEGCKKLCCLPVTFVHDFIDHFEDNGKVIFDKDSKALEDAYVTVIAQNIRNYAASDHHLWDTARGQVDPMLQPQAQSASDGLLEFLAFPAGFGIALEQMPLMQGNSRRLHQGAGPFFFTFTGRHPIYFNVDGEYYAAFGMKDVRITLSPFSHQLRVMHAADAPI